MVMADGQPRMDENSITDALLSQEAREGPGSPGVTGAWDPPAMGVRIGTQVLCKSSKLSLATEPPLQPLKGTISSQSMKTALGSGRLM